MVLRVRDILPLLVLFLVTCQRTPVPDAGDPWETGLGLIHGGAMVNIVKELGAIGERSRERTQYWGRITGSPEELATAEYLADRFRAAGVPDVAVWSFPINIARPNNWDVSAGSGDVSLHLESAMAVRNEKTFVPPEVRVLAPVVQLGRGNAEDFARADVDGKIVFVHRYDPDSLADRTTGPGDAFDRATAGGAAAFLFGGLIPGHLQTVPAFGAPMAGLLLDAETDRRIPAFCLSVEDGLALGALLTEQSIVTGSIRMAYDPEVYTKSWNVEARIPGRDDDWVILVGHIDGYFSGAIDNGNAMAGLVHLAQAIAAVPAAHRQKSYMIVGVGAHHDGSIGMRELIRRYRERIPRVSYGMNIDHLAASVYKQDGLRMVQTDQERSRRMQFTRDNPRLLQAFQNAINRYGFALRPVQNGWYGIGCGGDHHISCNLYSGAYLTSPPQFSHSSGDTWETFTAESLEACVKAHFDVIRELDSVPRASLQTFTRQGSYQVDFNINEQ